MGKAAQALKQTLETYGISQSRLAKTLGVDRPIVFRWFHGRTDPTAETVVQIVQALRMIMPSAAATFVDLYLGQTMAGAPISVDSSRLLGVESINISVLSKVFEGSQDSYTYIFFLALLDILEYREFDPSLPIYFRELTLEILIYGWRLACFFRLSLGTNDLIAHHIKSLQSQRDFSDLYAVALDRYQLRKQLKKRNYEPLLRYTSRFGAYRLLCPYFESSLQSLRGMVANQTILDLAATQTYQCSPPYRFNGDRVNECSALLIQPDWADYLKTNFSMIKGWVSWQWLQFMKRYNPNAVNLVNKLFIPPIKRSLTAQMQFWQSTAASHPLRCLYSGELLDPQHFTLDHYLPWSFVAHDHVWNLAPITQAIQPLRTHHIPADRYLRDFIDRQHLALTTNHQRLPSSAWQRAIAPYINDLKLNSEDVLDREKLFKAYELTYDGLKKLALQQGFQDGWVHPG